MTESFRLHRSAAVRTSRRPPPPAPVVTTQVDRDLWRAAIALAQERGLALGWVRLQAVSATEALIVNTPPGREVGPLR